LGKNANFGKFTIFPCVVTKKKELTRGMVEYFRVFLSHPRGVISPIGKNNVYRIPAKTDGKGEKRRKKKRGKCTTLCDDQGRRRKKRPWAKREHHSFCRPRGGGDI